MDVRWRYDGLVEVALLYLWGGNESRLPEAADGAKRAQAGLLPPLAFPSPSKFCFLLCLLPSSTFGTYPYTFGTFPPCPIAAL